jgi:hypothetical protein
MNSQDPYIRSQSLPVIVNVMLHFVSLLQVSVKPNLIPLKMVM